VPYKTVPPTGHGHILKKARPYPELRCFSLRGRDAPVPIPAFSICAYKNNRPANSPGARAEPQGIQAVGNETHRFRALAEAIAALQGGWAAHFWRTIRKGPRSVAPPCPGDSGRAFFRFSFSGSTLNRIICRLPAPTKSHLPLGAHAILKPWLRGESSSTHSRLFCWCIDRHQVETGAH